MIKFNPNSGAHLSALFFGGMFEVEVQVPDGFYKNGNPRTKKVKKLVPISGLGLKPRAGTMTKKDGVYSVDEEILIWIRDEL